MLEDGDRAGGGRLQGEGKIRYLGHVAQQAEMRAPGSASSSGPGRAWPQARALRDGLDVSRAGTGLSSPPQSQTGPTRGSATAL